MTVTTTWAKLREEAQDLGLFGEVLETLRRLTAPERHEARVIATMAAVQEAAASSVEGALLLALDLSGVGGRADLEGTATLRVPACRKLGKGRWRARDGGAYRAAAEDALRRLLSAASGDTLRIVWKLRPVMGGGLGLWADPNEPPVAEIEPGEELAPWVAALATREALRAAGYPAPGLDLGEFGIEPDSTPAAWSGLAADNKTPVI